MESYLNTNTIFHLCKSIRIEKKNVKKERKKKTKWKYMMSQSQPQTNESFIWVDTSQGSKFADYTETHIPWFCFCLLFFYVFFFFFLVF